nr:MAG TPA: hypothetical protein [Caudoviricetes sp.]
MRSSPTSSTSAFRTSSQGAGRSLCSSASIKVRGIWLRSFFLLTSPSIAS